MTDIKQELRMSEKTKIVYGFEDGHVEIHTRNLVSRHLPNHVFDITYSELGLALEALKRAKFWGDEVEKLKAQIREKVKESK